MKDKVLLDMDGVIANFYAGFARYLNKNLDTNLDVNKEPSTYSLHHWGHNIQNDIINAQIPKWMMSGGYTDLPIYPMAKEFVYSLMELYDVYIVTARIGDFRMDLSKKTEDTIIKDTYKWLEKYNIPTNNLFFEHKKIDFCKNNGISILIEDKLSTAIDGAKNEIKSILVNRGWNQNGEAWYGEILHRNYKNLYVAENYNHILKIMESISGA